MHTRRGGDSTAGSFLNGKRLAKHCATATGGIHPPLGKRISAPQVNVCSTAGKCSILLGGIMQARPQEPPEVYSNLLPPSVGETTGGIHPMPSGITISAPPEVNVPYSWAE